MSPNEPWNRYIQLFDKRTAYTKTIRFNGSELQKVILTELSILDKCKPGKFLKCLKGVRDNPLVQEQFPFIEARIYTLIQTLGGVAFQTKIKRDVDEDVNIDANVKFRMHQLAQKLVNRGGVNIGYGQWIAWLFDLPKLDMDAMKD